MSFLFCCYRCWRGRVSFNLIQCSKLALQHPWNSKVAIFTVSFVSERLNIHSSITFKQVHFRRAGLSLYADLQSLMEQDVVHEVSTSVTSCWCSKFLWCVFVAGRPSSKDLSLGHSLSPEHAAKNPQIRVRLWGHCWDVPTQTSERTASKVRRFNGFTVRKEVCFLSLKGGQAGAHKNNPSCSRTIWKRVVLD